MPNGGRAMDGRLQGLPSSACEMRPVLRFLVRHEAWMPNRGPPWMAAASGRQAKLVIPARAGIRA